MLKYLYLTTFAAALVIGYQWGWLGLIAGPAVLHGLWALVFVVSVLVWGERVK